MVLADGCLLGFRYVDQGGGKRKGAFAMYLEPWHADVFDFIDLRKNHGKEEVGLPALCYQAMATLHACWGCTRKPHSAHRYFAMPSVIPGQAMLSSTMTMR